MKKLEKMTPQILTDEERKERIQEQIQDIIDGMSATHEIPQPQLDRLQEQLDELFNGGGGGEDPRVDGLIREVRALAQTVNGQSSSITNLQQSVSQLTQTVSGQSSDISDLENSVSQLTQTVSGQTSDISDLESSVSQLTQTVTGQASDISGLETSVSQLTQAVTSQGTAIGSLQSDVSQLNSDISYHSASIGLLQTNLSQLTQTVNGQGTDISALQTSVSQLTLRLNNLSSDDVSFDNTGTDLDSTDVHDAIVEVNDKLKTRSSTFTLTANIGNSASGAVYRVGNVVTLTVTYIDCTSTGSHYLNTIPYGFRPAIRSNTFGVNSGAIDYGNAQYFTVNIDGSIEFYVYHVGTAGTFSITYLTNND